MILTLRDHWTATHLSLAETVNQHLSPAQEDALVDKVIDCASRGTLLTPRHIHNLAAAVGGEQIGENWVARFVDYHSDKLSS